MVLPREDMKFPEVISVKAQDILVAEYAVEHGINSKSPQTASLNTETYAWRGFTTFSVTSEAFPRTVLKQLSKNGRFYLGRRQVGLEKWFMSGRES